MKNLIHALVVAAIFSLMPLNANAQKYSPELYVKRDEVIEEISKAYTGNWLHNSYLLPSIYVNHDDLLDCFTHNTLNERADCIYANGYAVSYFRKPTHVRIIHEDREVQERVKSYLYSNLNCYNMEYLIEAGLNYYYQAVDKCIDKALARSSAKNETASRIQVNMCGKSGSARVRTDTLKLFRETCERSRQDFTSK
ncbi:MAG: hypothetical protein FWE93_00935 [Alphaproteobacteria bacterium]|nr:hypothetical protein [Alphaproteobacteria bacterium]